MTSAAAATSGAAGTSSAAAATSAAATTSSAPAPTKTKVVAKGGGTFCKDIANTLNDAGTTGTTDTVAAEKALVEKGLAELAVLTVEAPSEIKSDVQTLAGAVSVLYGAVQKANYDFTKIDTTALSALDTPAVKASETKVDAYVKVHCGIDVGAGASSSS
ncbi:hypothetical protein acdb102_12420 [Acidothermaceae bacterium B102]|nr:hypothetical protein acdb102_12420 [Acidothermaceae bacterium B102]